MTVGIEMGVSLGAGAEPALMDLEELLATRLLVQGNSGSGKSHLLRRLLEQSAGAVQQVVIDPEGDFVTLAAAHGHVVVDGAHGESDLQAIAARVRAHRVSVVLDLESLDAEAQMRAAAAFLGGLFEAERAHWYPVLVVVDEAQVFAPAAAGEVSDEARKASLGAMTNLMCRGRKRGLAGVIATQRLAKLAKNVAAEATNFLMGRTFLDIDMARAADLLGLDRRGAERFRDLARGEFVALGPALSRRPLALRIGPVFTGSRAGSPTLIPLPQAATADLRALILTRADDEPAAWTPAPRATPTPRTTPAELMRELGRHRPEPVEAAPTLSEAEIREGIEAVLRGIADDRDAAGQPVAVVYQDFLVRCRMRGLDGEAITLSAFRRRLGVARAGVDEEAAGVDPQADARWEEARSVAAALPDEVQGLFLLLARAALAAEPCPGDEALARAIGSRSPGRARRLLSYIETRGTIVCRMDYRGNRVVALPGLGCETAPGDPKASPGDPKAPPSEVKGLACEGKAVPPEGFGLFAAE
ncbi:ATP-binding protein [Methylobacterium sp. Leaf108]|uniref:ATP-binding protein n=1 Tax=Methylobacterium sp. Leaf108 TaxID=1736256 RepID=UPI0006FEFAF0|nr:ATP-binding protein [Methylobacterium sp. Leaf108]KQP48986.1 ATP-binding protein [Methylobacterium sp. Leaf108]